MVLRSAVTGHLIQSTGWQGTAGERRQTNRACGQAMRQRTAQTSRRLIEGVADEVPWMD